MIKQDALCTLLLIACNPAGAGMLRETFRNCKFRFEEVLVARTRLPGFGRC